MSFQQLNLSQPILSALDKCGYSQPTPIQEQAIPRALEGKDLIAIAQTGTGKTDAFLLPALECLLNSPKQLTPSILILAPARELVFQITDAVRKYSSHNIKSKVASIVGGMPYHAQLRQLSQPLDILVATPGRLIDHIERRKIDLSKVKIFILDEADRMLDMGFIDDVNKIAQQLPKKHQTLLFTATMDEAINRLARNILHEPEHIAIAGKTTSLEKIKQFAYMADDQFHKDRLLNHLLQADDIQKAIIFSETKRAADKLNDKLSTLGHATNVLHGDIQQRKRNQTLQSFRRGDTKFLIATNVAARGLDIHDISHVINYDLPMATEDYVHRIGRTGRAGRDGVAISLVLMREYGQLKRIEKFMRCDIDQLSIIGLEPKQQPSSPKNNNSKNFRRGSRSNNNSSNNSKKPHRKNFSRKSNNEGQRRSKRG